MHLLNASGNTRKRAHHLYGNKKGLLDFPVHKYRAQTEPTFWAGPNEKLYSVSENVQSSAFSSLQAFRLNYVPFAQSPATYFENSN